MTSTIIDGTSEQVAAVLTELEQRWGIEGFAEATRVRFSSRFTRNFGTCRVTTGEITLAQRLTDHPEALLEVLVHEAAHFAAYRLHGPRQRHHGPHWKELMRAAGLEPRRCMPPLPGDPPPQRRRSGYWLHSCRWCDAQRIGRRPVRAWNCVACYQAGRGHSIVITRLDD